MTLVYKPENDICFKPGEALGRNEAEDQRIGSMLQKGLLTHEQLAEIAEVPVDRVKAMAHQLANQ
ncbi:hypothetical protein [Fibrella aestuarina]|nr:hypothetical protein [Fibrella aestuarina]